MNEPSFTTTITVDATPAQAFAAINDVSSWWTYDIEGTTDELGAEFTFRGGDVHRSQIRVSDLVPGKRVEWQVLDNYMSFVQDQSEWRGTTIDFDISTTEAGTQVRFRHIGLVPAYECYDQCSNAWAFFVTNSLRSRITTGAGHPMTPESAPRAAQLG